MTLLLVKWGKGVAYNLFSPSTYGMSSWGSNHQDSLDKKRKYWYIVSWHAGNDYVDDETYSSKLNVVVETTDISAVVSYLWRKLPREKAKEALRQIYKDYKEIVDDYIRWGIGEIDRENR